jgi:hypothetical protein
VDCGTYIEKYLSAQVDGELSADELREAEEHLAGCVNCRARFAEERAVKALLRERAEMRRTPPMVRGSILAALDAIDASGAANAGRDRAASADRGGRFAPRHARVWIPAALAAAAVFALVMLHGGNPPPAHAIAPFDIAVKDYAQFDEHFEPNLKSTAPADISDAYMDQKLPGFLWDFNQRGYKLIGGRIDHLADGTPVSSTFYRGDSGTILCTYMKSHGLRPPPGEVAEDSEPSVYSVEHHYYHYKGYSICLSYPPGGCICILVSKRSMKEFVQDISDSSL